MLTKTSFRILLLLAFLQVLLLKGAAQKLESRSITRSDLDSIDLLVDQCITDTCRFRVLQSYFWLYASYDMNRVRSIGEQAYGEVRNSKNPQIRADGFDIKGFLYEKEEKYDSAAFFFHKALYLARKTGYDRRIRWSYYHLGLIYGAAGNPDSAVYYFKTLNRQYPSDISSSPSDYDVYRQLAYLFDDTYEMPDSAEKYFQQMLFLSRESSDAQREIESQINLMNLYYKTNQIKNLLETINTTLVLAEKNSHEKALINIYNMIGDMFLVNKKNYELALVYYNKVLEICRPKYKQWEATILNDIGDLYMRMGNDTLALRYVNEGLRVAKTMNLKHQISESYRNLGVIYKSQGRLPEAIHHFQICYNTGCDKCSKVVFHQALIDIADSYMALQNPDKAFDYYNQSLDLAMEFKANKELAVSSLRLGNYYSLLDNGKSKAYYLSAIQYARQSNDLKTIKIISDTLSSYFRKQNNFKAAYEYQMLARTMEDSIIQIDNQASLADWELKFEIEKINKENQTNERLAAAEIKRQKAFRNGTLLIALLLVVLGLVVYSGYRRKKKDNSLLEKMSDELHQADEMKLRFFSNISHEFRTPLTLILNPAKSLLETGTVEGESKKQLEYIYNNALKLRDLTNQIMDLQKLDAGKLTLKPEEADIIEYCVGVASSFESLCYKKNNSVAICSNHRSVIASFDKDKVGKILSNLLSNAFKFCYEASVIEMLMEISNHNFTLSIKDKGLGIPSDEIDKAFKQYYQASTNNQTEGTGIGLAYVKELAEFMKGKANIKSTVQQGTLVTVTIPLATCVIADAAELEHRIPKTGLDEIKPFIIADEQNEDRNTVLIAEDNDELRNFIGDLLKADYNLILAANGREGAKAAFKYLPDIIVSDVMMPDMNGFDMCSLLKKDERTSHIPVILLTAKDGSQSSLEGYQTGADDYIIKPFDNELLKLKIRNIIATGEASRRQFDLKSMLSVDSYKFGNTDKGFMKKCLAIIEKHIDNSDFSVELLAEEMSFSNRNFYRKIKALTNQTPAELVRIYRLHYAKRLLQNTDMKVFEIAMAIGYEDVNRFRQAYKKLFGFPPSESINNVVA